MGWEYCEITKIFYKEDSVWDGPEGGTDNIGGPLCKKYVESTVYEQI